MNTINNIIIDSSPMGSAIATKSYTVFGDPGSVFTMTVTNEDTSYYNFSEELDKNGQLKTALAFSSTPASLAPKTIGEDGTYTNTIQFPAITGDDEYTIILLADSANNTSLDKSLSNNNVYVLPKIYKYHDTTVTFSLVSAGSDSTYNDYPSNVTAVGVSTSVIARQPLATDLQFTTTTTTSSASDTTGETIYVEVADITGISPRMGVTGTGIASNSIVREVIPGYKDYNKSSDLEDVYVIPKGILTNSQGEQSVGDGTGGTIIISNASTWNSGVTLTFTGSIINAEDFNSTVCEISNLSLAIDPVVTTTDAAVSNSKTIPITSTNGIKAADTVLMSGIGVTTTAPHVDTVNANVSVVVDTNQTIENGQTVTFTGSSRSATITADVKVVEYGTDNITLTLALDNILTVG